MMLEKKDIRLKLIRTLGNSKKIFDKIDSELIFLVLCALIVRIIALISTDNIIRLANEKDGIFVVLDAIGRELNALDLFKGQGDFGVPDNGIRLPMHAWLIYSIIGICKDIIIAPRVVHLILGVATVVVFYKLITLVFEKRIAFYSSLFLVFFHKHVILSVITLSEIPFMLSVITSIYFLYKYTIQRNMRDIVIPAFILVIASLIRYEAWILSFLFIVYLIYFNVKNNMKAMPHIMAYIFIVSAPWIYWMCWNWIYRGNVFSFIHLHTFLNFSEWFPDTKMGILFYWPNRLYDDFKFIALFLSLIGWIYCVFVKKKGRLIALCFLSLFIFYTVGCLTYRVGAHFEYIFNAEIFLIPFTIAALAYIDMPKNIKNITVSALTFICIFSTLPMLAKEITENRINMDDKITFQYIQKNFKIKDNIVVYYDKPLDINSDRLRTVALLLLTYSNSNIMSCGIRDIRKDVLEYMIANKPECIICSKDAFFRLNSLKFDKQNLILRPSLVMEDYVVVKNYYN